MKSRNSKGIKPWISTISFFLAAGLLRGYFTMIEGGHNADFEQHWLPALLVASISPTFYGLLFIAAILTGTNTTPKDHHPKIRTPRRAFHLLRFCIAMTITVWMMPFAYAGLSLFAVPVTTLTYAVDDPVLFGIVFVPFTAIALVIYFTETEPGDEESGENSP